MKNVLFYQQCSKIAGYAGLDIYGDFYSGSPAICYILFFQDISIRLQSKWGRCYKNMYHSRINGTVTCKLQRDTDILVHQRTISTPWRSKRCGDVLLNDLSDLFCVAFRHTRRGYLSYILHIFPEIYLTPRISFHGFERALRNGNSF